MINTINKVCRYYPCHDKEKLESCTFCFCPLWPCNDASLGKPLKNGVWDCSKCTWPHDKKRVDKLFEFLKENWKG
jgi:Zn-finger protein